MKVGFQVSSKSNHGLRRSNSLYWHRISCVLGRFPIELITYCCHYTSPGIRDTTDSLSELDNDDVDVSPLRRDSFRDNANGIQDNFNGTLDSSLSLSVNPDHENQSTDNDLSPSDSRETLIYDKLFDASDICEVSTIDVTSNAAITSEHTYSVPDNSFSIKVV